MKGLLKNEFFTMRRVILLYAGVLLLYYLLGVFGTQMAGVQIFSVFFCTMLVIALFPTRKRAGGALM